MKLNLKNKKDIDDKVLRTIIQYGLGFASRVKTLEEKCIDDWKSDKLYDKSSFVIYDGYIWKAKVTNQSSTWDKKYWNKVGDELSLIELDDIKAMLNLTDEQLKTLSSLILDSEIRLDKTFSSSRIYSDIQQCLSDSKTYTLKQLAKKTGASYKIATSTTDMTSTEYLYLLANANNAYDIYALIDGTATKIGDTTIDLSQFYTKEQIDSDFLKKTDADGKYATQASFNSHTSDTDIHISATEKASYVKKTDITTTIDENSTEEQIPNAKAIYNSLFKSDSSIINYTSQIEKNITNVQSFWSTTVKKIGNIVAFSVNITTNDVNSYTVQLGILPEAVRPNENININLISNMGKNCYIYVDATGKFGFTMMSSTNKWVKGDGCRMYFSYLVEK